MTTTQTAAAHTITYVTTSNGAPAKGRRFRCSCGRHGARFAFGPAAGRTQAQAQAKAEKDAAAHVAGEW
jgi:hypothetical protein